MNGASRSAGAGGARLRRSVRAQAILSRHFGFPRTEVESYFARAAKRERRTVNEIEKAVISLACDLV